MMAAYLLIFLSLASEPGQDDFILYSKQSLLLNSVYVVCCCMLLYVVVCCMLYAFKEDQRERGKDTRLPRLLKYVTIMT